MSKPKSKAESEHLRAQARAMFLEGATLQEIAKRLGVHRTTLWHWRAQERWDDELRQMASLAYERVRPQILTRRLQDLLDVTEATRTYVQALLARAGEAERVPLLSLVKIVEALKELVAREMERMGPDERASEGEEIRVEWHA